MGITSKKVTKEQKEKIVKDYERKKNKSKFDEERAFLQKYFVHLENSIYVIKRFEDTFKKVKILGETFDENLKNTQDFFKQMMEQLSSQTNILQKVVDINTNVEETLCNVLVAIRQNEYLQAWYPPQQGNSEQYVAGSYNDEWSWKKCRKLNGN